jgi:hypothetical protein
MPYDLLVHRSQTGRARYEWWCGTARGIALVYALYGLTEEEIAIVEGTT